MQAVISKFCFFLMVIYPVFFLFLLCLSVFHLAVYVGRIFVTKNCKIQHLYWSSPSPVDGCWSVFPEQSFIMMGI